jgi:DNA-directed RNA polymerase specialized sigma24 family protein
LKPRRPTLAAIGRFYEDRYQRLLRVAEAILGDPDLAHDAVQDGFARIIRSRRSFRDEGSVEGWIYRPRSVRLAGELAERQPGHARLAGAAGELRRPQRRLIREVPGRDATSPP